jgi:hypothetical protein
MRDRYWMIGNAVDSILESRGRELRIMGRWRHEHQV